MKSRQRCQRYENISLNYPGPPELLDRVKLSNPFQTTCVHNTGAILVTSDDGRFIMVYICLFTRASTRAVLVEFSQDLNVETFLQLFRRFAARRPAPKRWISDFSNNFTGASSILSVICNNPSLREDLEVRCC